MSDYRSTERTFNLDAMERSNWRSRINQLKRELKSGDHADSAAHLFSTSAPNLSGRYGSGVRASVASPRSADPGPGPRRATTRRRSPRRTAAPGATAGRARFRAS